LAIGSGFANSATYKWIPKIEAKGKA
jgi:hypothetical protein